MSKSSTENQRGKNTTEARRAPVQARAVKRRAQILDTTAELLEEVGVDDLTTILVAKRLQISVGSLYHYYPNKIAILYALSQRWLTEITLALDDISAHLAEILTLHEFTDRCTERLLEVYRSQKGILHLVQAMFSIPELREMDQAHDQLMIERFGQMFTRLGLNLNASERERVASVYLELIHAMAIEIVEHSAPRASRTTADLKLMAYTLLAQHQND